MKNINKRDIKLFLLGMLAMLLMEAIYDWDGTVGRFLNGMKHGMVEELKKTK
jgi:hypothetical protein